MSTVANTIVAAIVAQLQAAPPVCPHIWRARLRPLSRSQQQAIVVAPVQMEAEEGINPGGCTLRKLVVRIECYSREGNAQAPDAAVSDLLHAAYARLMQPDFSHRLALADLGVSWEFAAADESLCCAILSLQAHATTASDSLAA